MAAARSGGLPVEVVGTSSANLVEPCEQRAPKLERPPAPPAEPAFALSFSGGGWRAALSAAGALRFVADAGLLGRVRWLSSVSGGSITSALLAVGYEEVRERGFDAVAVDERVLRPLLGAARDRSLSWALVRNAWRALGRRTRTDVLADVLDDWLLGGRLLGELTAEVRFVFNAANATTGVRFGFERQRVGDYVLGYIPTSETTFRLADAVAASAAVPGAFAAVSLRGLAFPCGEGSDVRLLDGGVYDNLGLEAIDDLRGPCLVAVSAGGVLRTGHGGPMRFVPAIRDLKRSSSLLYRQATTLRTRGMVERFRAWERTPPGEEPPEWARCGVLFGLATSMDEDNPAWRDNREWRDGRPENGENRVRLATSKTTFSRRSAELSRGLVYRGWWLAGATLSTFHRELLPPELPEWRELP